MSTPPPAVLAAFDFGGDITAVTPYGEGHINLSFAVTAATSAGPRRYLLQTINPRVFADAAGVMANIVGVTAYLRTQIAAAGGDPERETLTVVPTRDQQSYHRDTDGTPWRVYRFVEGTVCYSSPPRPAVFEAAGRAFGEFARRLEGYPAATLHETIPHFHDTVARFAAFRTAVAADSAGRVGECAAEIDFALGREADCAVLRDQLAEGRLPLRVTHNDTKLNNILMDPVRDAGVCVVDLDTVMPGLAVHDYGDAIRFGASTAAEDEPDVSLVHVSLPLFEAFTAGYVPAAGLTRAETDNLLWGARLMTFECGLRFLTDYLQSDTYFHTTRPRQNLDRCRTQFALVAEMESLAGPLTRIIQRYAG